ncbi:lipoprotein-anchoring transpeptidase ErfK/SrfK [Symbiobacterium terraclitae]|uniref:Lipoprotein-anchoring transpeptidase ErfK/SrfK n=1 Tax=Symbiobacterium terraclitae TaxID=557451 RepID=A0ABS4JRS7_9FIRM|nr:L,D-transpeptidase [Symbiobacterium terraclitae]MBP2017596.1 lipoprotein-anchoring transpeptidase ErfK/SrfK [Symbiobacterium terraclitae]
MSHLYEPDRPRSARREWRRREERRRRYARRRAVALLVVTGLLVGLGFGIRWVVLRLSGTAEPTAAPPSRTPDAQSPAALPFTPERLIPGPDLNDDGVPERIAVSALEDGRMRVALLTGPEDEPGIVGQVVTVAEGTVDIVVLPRAGHLLVWRGSLPGEGEPVAVAVGGDTALEARGGEPFYRAWSLDMNFGLVPADYYAAAAPLTPPEPTVILVDKGLNVLWHYRDGELVQTARVSTGRHIAGPAPSPANWGENMVTPLGRFTVDRLVPGMPYYKEGIPALDPANPLGTRWIGFSVFPGDNGSLWAIHGTHAPESLGRWNSEGSILMSNREVEKLYDAVELGTPIVIQDSLTGR